MARSLAARMCGVVLIALWSLVVVATIPGVGQAESRMSGRYPAAAPQLVEAALAAELKGDAAQRSELLTEAVGVDKNYAPARWQSGQTKFQGQWRTPDEVASLVKSDDRWKEYQRLRDMGDGSPASETELAQWCLRHELAGEERYHWSNVLLANPQHKLARERLGLQVYRGRLVTNEKAEEIEQEQKGARQNLSKFKPQFAKLCREAVSKDSATRKSALQKIKQIDDPAALEPLTDAVTRAIGKDEGQVRRDLTLALVGAISNVPQHDATLQLLELAVNAEVPEVRRLAAEKLRSRKSTDYVPLLMAALSAPVETEVSVVAMTDGTVRMIETISQAEFRAKRSHVRTSNYEVEGALTHDRTLDTPEMVRSRHLAGAARRAQATQAQAQSISEQTEERNKRIIAVLESAAGIGISSGANSQAEGWWSSWKRYNELEYGEPTKHETYESNTYTFAYEQQQVYYPNDQPARRAAPTRPTFGSLGAMPGRGFECFAPGTPVWTQSGLVPIEQIRVGDMVLAKHPATGELDYKPVRDVTVGRESAVMTLEFPEERITSTLGHRFWVNGRGWEMVKAMEPSMSLHGLHGALEICSITKSEPIACYNLVVGGFHTFFVGKSQILVHDKTCPQPAIANVPGSVEPRPLVAAPRQSVESAATMAQQMK